VPLTFPRAGHAPCRAPEARQATHPSSHSLVNRLHTTHRVQPHAHAKHLDWLTLWGDGCARGGANARLVRLRSAAPASDLFSVVVCVLRGGKHRPSQSAVSAFWPCTPFPPLHTRHSNSPSDMPSLTSALCSSPLAPDLVVVLVFSSSRSLNEASILSLSPLYCCPHLTCPIALPTQSLTPVPHTVARSQDTTIEGIELSLTVGAFKDIVKERTGVEKDHQVREGDTHTHTHTRTHTETRAHTHAHTQTHTIHLRHFRLCR
jgi:hypothetical protein